MNNKGAIGMRQMFIMMILLAGTFILIGLFVTDMADSYDNVEMRSEWEDSNLSTSGYDMYDQVNSDVLSFKNDTEKGVIGELTKSLGNLGVAIDATGSVIAGIFSAPEFLGNIVSTALTTLKVPKLIADIIGVLVVSFFWIVVILSVISLALRGGKDSV